LVSGLVYAPVQVATMIFAALAVWGLPDTWEWTQELSLAKATVCFSCFWGALFVMATQTYQPFIYYIF
jgi:alginate O-acetyltransferase complex protein AlgI